VGILNSYILSVLFKYNVITLTSFGVQELNMRVWTAIFWLLIGPSDDFFMAYFTAFRIADQGLKDVR
jgi:hypothetical protein